MRYRIRITRVQTVDRNISATDEEAALDKVRAELKEPWGIWSSQWSTVAQDVEVLGTETKLPGPVGGVTDGPLLLSIKDAAKHLGISYSTVYELLNRGELEYVRVGTRRYISRAGLNKFIEVNTRTGYEPRGGR